MKLGGDPGFYALAVALSTDTNQALTVVDLAKQTPPGSLVDRITLGEFRAAVELKRGNPGQALQYLEPARCCEAGWFDMYQAAYLRGLAYLMAHRGQEAAVEFQKILDHPGIVVNQPIGILLVQTGGRTYSEGLSLRWDQVDLDRNAEVGWWCFEDSLFLFHAQYVLCGALAPFIEMPDTSSGALGDILPSDRELEHALEIFHSRLTIAPLTVILGLRCDGWRRP